VNTRKKGRKFEKREAKVWQEAGWEIELVRPETWFIGPGKVITAYRDFFGRYDIIAVSKVGIVIFIQVSTEPVSSHVRPGPMGFIQPRWSAALDSVPVDHIMINNHTDLWAGVYEAYVRYRKRGRSYVAERTWWTPKL